jgi:HEAT repeat protein
MPCAVSAQDEAVVNAVAAVLTAEDARLFTPSLVNAARHPDPIVRRRAALALGRIGDPAGTAALLELLDDPVPAIRKDAAFALGLLADPSAFDRLREVVAQTPLTEHGAPEAEALTAIIRLGGHDAAEFIGQFLTRWSGRASSGEEAPVTVLRALREAWRLGDAAPLSVLLQYGETVVDGARLRAVYSLGRLRANEAASVFMRAVDDPIALTRSFAVRALTAEFADSAGLERVGTCAASVPMEIRR